MQPSLPFLSRKSRQLFFYHTHTQSHTNEFTSWASMSCSRPGIKQPTFRLADDCYSVSCGHQREFSTLHNCSILRYLFKKIASHWLRSNTHHCFLYVWLIYNAVNQTAWHTTSMKLIIRCTFHDYYSLLVIQQSFWSLTAGKPFDFMGLTVVVGPSAEPTLEGQCPMSHWPSLSRRPIKGHSTSFPSVFCTTTTRVELSLEARPHSYPREGRRRRRRRAVLLLPVQTSPGWCASGTCAESEMSAKTRNRERCREALNETIITVALC